VPKYFNFATFLMIYLSSCYEFILHSGDEMSTYTVFSVITSRPTSLLASLRAIVVKLTITKIRRLTPWSREPLQNLGAFKQLKKLPTFVEAEISFSFLHESATAPYVYRINFAVIHSSISDFQVYVPFRVLD
jgi:hypothetical protein